MLVETHAHLDYPDFAADLDDVIARAVEHDVTRIITIGTSVESSQRAIALAEEYESVFAVIGVHPTSETTQDDVITPLRELAKHPRVVAIGETGLDYHSLPGARLVEDKKVQVFANALQGETEEQIDASIEDGAVKSRQAMLFEEQLDLAVELGLNVVIHQRDAWTDTLEILKKYSGKLRGVFHCFSGTREQAEEVISMGHLVSFTGIVTFKNGAGVRDVAAQIPLEKLMVETDCPYLAPVPFRGKRCEPAYTRIVAEWIADARGIQLPELANVTTETADEFFRFTK